ncbi:MAG: hypothetical protein J6V07_04405 [Clostridia bacterium]|nr:hypothetical protein [Clostridia bacterium]
MALQRKSLAIKRFGWRRIAKNTARFGWSLYDAVEETEITETTSYKGKIYSDGNIEIKEHVDTSSKVTVHLSFFRDTQWFSNLHSIYPLELFYNIVFTLRRIAAFFMPLVFGGFLILAVIGMSDMLFEEGYDSLMLALLGSWAGLIFLETILARIAGGILKVNGADGVYEEPQQKQSRRLNSSEAEQKQEKPKLPFLKRVLYTPFLCLCTLCGVGLGASLSDGSSADFLGFVCFIVALAGIILSIIHTFTQVNGKNSYKLYNSAYFILVCAIKIAVGFACGFLAFLV